MNYEELKENNQQLLAPYKSVWVDSSKQEVSPDLAAIFEHISDAFIYIDRHWRYSYVNAQAEHLLNESREELLGRGIWEIRPPQMGSTFFQKASEAVEKQISLEYTEYHDLSQQWLAVRMAPAQNGITVFLQNVTEHKHVEEQLLFQTTILQNITNSVIVTDLEGKILYCNDEAERIFGYSEQELLGKTPATLYPDNDGAQMAQELQAILAGKPYIGEWLGQRKDGTRVWVEIKTTILRNQKGGPSGFIGVAKDITDRKQVEGALDLQQQEFQAIAEHAPDIIARLDAKCRYLYVNSAIEAATGLPTYSFIGKNSAEISALAHFLKPWEDGVQSVFKTGQEAFIEFEFPALAGNKWFEAHLVPEFVNQSMVSVLAISRDITERKRLAAELQTAKEQLEVILYNIAEGIMVQDASNKIIYANQAAAHLAGYTSVAELLQAPLLTYWEKFDLFDEQEHPLSAATLLEKWPIQGEVPAQRNIYFVNKETQTIHWVRLKSTAIAAIDQVPALVITIIQDITQFKELEQKKDEFILNVSHELRTPLTAVNGYLALLQDYDQQLDLPMKSLFLQQAIDNCDELTRLANTILDAIHIPKTMQAAQCEILSVTKIVREVLAQFDPQKKQAYILQMQIPEQLLVWANRHAVQQVLRNLLSNAFKYSLPQTPIVLSATRKKATSRADAPTYVCICVQDAGPGIPPAEQSQLFQKFVRLKRDLSGSVRGTGLGLYISKQLIETMGGDMWVESSGRPGEGSCFYFTLPEASHVAA